MRTPPGMNLLGPTGVVLAIIVICTQVLVVYNFRNKVASKIAEEEIDLEKAGEIEIGKSTKHYYTRFRKNSLNS